MLGSGFPWEPPEATPQTPRRSQPRRSRTPQTSPQKLLRSPPPVPAQRRRSPSPGSPLRELLESEDPNEGRFRRDFCDITPLARGQFSTVYTARHKTDRHLYAVKIQTAVQTAEQRRTPLREVFALAAAAAAGGGGAHLVRYFGCWQEDGRMHIQTELCDGSLRDCLQARASERPSDPRFGEEDMVPILRQVAGGLASLHGLGFAHLDVKPDNVLVGRDGLYKIGDFGLATSTSDGCNEHVPEGDCRYLAREVLQGRGHVQDLPKADVFSLGLVCYELATNPRELPPNGDDWQTLRDGCLNADLMPPLSADFVRLIRRMVHKVPGERPPSVELVGFGRAASPADELQALRQELRKAQEEARLSRQQAEEYHNELLATRWQGQYNIASLGG